MPEASVSLLQRVRLLWQLPQGNDRDARLVRKATWRIGGHAAIAIEQE